MQEEQEKKNITKFEMNWLQAYNDSLIKCRLKSQQHVSKKQSSKQVWRRTNPDPSVASNIVNPF